jgi:hypothetical protein
MQSLNDDMEDLFRRAGEEYPLNTNGADWNKVMQGLHDPKDTLHEENKKHRDYRYLWLLLLFPIGIICGRYISMNNHDASPKGNKQVSTTTGLGKSELTGAASPVHKEKADSRDEPFADKAVIKVSKDKVVSVAAKQATSKTNQRVNTVGSAYKKFNSSSKKAKPVDLVVRTSANKTGVRISNNEPPGNQSTTVAGIQDVEKAAIAKNASSTPIDNSAPVDRNNNTKSFSLKTDTSALDNSTVKSSIETNEQSRLVTTKMTNKSQPSFKRKLFYSLVIGPDVSTVKFYKTSKVGYSLGLMLGYQISRKITIEAGALWDRKNYYAAGNYLDTSYFQLPSHSIVSKVNGYCDMIEIPLNVRYDLITRPGHSWFVSAGLSSYLMSKEDYDVNYDRYGVSYLKDYSYNNSSEDWFAVMNISAGYKTSISKHTTVSFAPYIKLPLGGVGVGKLPITSTGVYISISRPFR